ncbi:MAG: hypothetical protein J0M12_04850 [Deltaproteobacteria bacterium]|nr:hypothetical protein [Deltaproteobacteria bacterium]
MASNQAATIAPAGTAPRALNVADFLLSFGLVTLLFTSLAGSLSFWEEGFIDLFPASRYSIIVPLLLIFSALAKSGFRVTDLRLDERGFACGLLVMFISDWPTRSYNLLQGPFIRGEIILGALGTLWILRAGRVALLRYALPLTVLLLVSCFFIEARGRLLFSDDNPTFLYRLMLLKENFPSIPFFNPLWNAGIESRDFFATGSLNVFFLFAPLIYLFQLTQVYNFIIVLILFVLLPLSLRLAAKLAGLKTPATAISGLLALTCSLLWYRWALKYGTLGFVTSACLLPLNLVVAARLLSGTLELHGRTVLLTALSFTLMLFWSPSGLAFIPLIPLVLIRAPKLLRQRNFIWLALLLLLINLPWIIVFWRVSNVGSFLKTEKPSYSAMSDASDPAYAASAQQNDTHINTKPRTSSFSAKTSLKMLRENSVSTNPLLVLLALPGLLLLPARVRLAFILCSGWLLLLGSVGAQLKPQLELERMLILCYLCLCIPVAGSVERVLRLAQSEHRKIAVLPALVVGGYLLAAPFSTAAILLNRSIERFYFARAELQELVETINSNTHEGRALFSGFVLHDLYHGHIAPLAMLTGKPLVASSPFHDQWRYKEIFPTTVTDAGDSGIDSFLDLMNATLVFAHEERWQEYFASRPQEFERVGKDDHFWAFRRKNYRSDYFLKGVGEIIEQNSNSVRLTTTTPDAVIKFSYFNFLTSTNCELSPFEAAAGLKLIQLSHCRVGEEILIHALSPLERVRRGAL